MQNPATEVIDYVKDQVTHPGVTPRKTFKKIKKSPGTLFSVWGQLVPITGTKCPR